MSRLRNKIDAGKIEDVISGEITPPTPVGEVPGLPIPVDVLITEGTGNIRITEGGDYRIAEYDPKLRITEGTGEYRITEQGENLVVE